MRPFNASLLILFYSLVPLLSCSENSVSPPVLITSFSVSDTDDVSLQPDFRQLDIFIYEDFQKIVITLWSDSNLIRLGDFIYLYGTNRDLIDFDSASYNIRRDPDADGHFEVLVAEGEVRWTNSTTFVFFIAKETFPDIAEKEVWIYSMYSKDRVPNTGQIQIIMPD